MEVTKILIIKPQTDIALLISDVLSSSIPLPAKFNWYSYAVRYAADVVAVGKKHIRHLRINVRQLKIKSYLKIN